MKIILVRHGESEANVQELLSSSVDDPFSVTTKGVAQVVEAARKINLPISAIHVSPLKRTLESASIIMSCLSIEPTLKPDVLIKEIDYGVYSGRPNNPELDDIRTRQSRGDYGARFGKTGESKFDIEMRLLIFIRDLLNKYSAEDSVLIVTHGSIINWMDRLLAQIEGRTLVHKKIKNGDVLEYTIDRMQVKEVESMIESLRAHGN